MLTDISFNRTSCRLHLVRLNDLHCWLADLFITLSDSTFVYRGSRRCSLRILTCQKLDPKTIQLAPCLYWLGMLPDRIFAKHDRSASPGAVNRYIVNINYSPSSNKLIKIAYLLSLAQLEERKTVTVTTINSDHLEARGSIPRGETLLALLGISFWPGIVVVDVFDRHPILGCK
jgi:hypothetical protein